MLNKPRQQGQTLIETLVAIFIMTMGLSAALGLANYALSASSNIIKQIIGMGLAREGLEAVKNMRDTNWLKDTLAANCYNFETAAGNASCYRSWMNPASGNNIDPVAASATYKLGFDPSTANFWQLQSESTNFTLNYNVAGTTGLYTPSVVGTSSGYYRRITIARDSTGPFAQDGVGPRLTITTDVWWNDKRCPSASVLTPPSSGNCKITLQSFLTNWKNY